MKWNMVIGALMISAALASQSYGFDLLDRMLGMKHSGHGCSSCGVEPSCGCDSGCGHEASCGCETSCCDSGNSCCNACQQYCCKTPDIFAGLFGCGCNHGCGSYGGNGHAAPAANGAHDAAPVPPAPMADPSAGVRHNRRVLPASRIIRK
jgi:hypothetical protein